MGRAVPGKEYAIAAQGLNRLRIDRDAAPRGGGGRVWIAVALIVMLLAVAGGVVWMRSDRPVRVEAATVRSSGTTPGAATVLNASGYVTARRQATISSKITGKLTAVTIEEGDRVEANQVLARLDATLYEAAVNLAEARLAASRSVSAETQARLDLARLDLARTERLVAEGVEVEARLDTDRAAVAALEARLLNEREQVRVAEQEVALRRAELGDTVIRAPYAGVVISKDAQEGEMVSPVSAGGGFTRTGVCTLVDMASLEIEVDVNESYISRVRAEQRADAVLDAYPDWQIPAEVITLVPAADRQKATVLVRIRFLELDPRILPDMGVKVAFRADEPDAEAAADRPALRVPEAAIRRVDGSEVVFVIRGDRVERRAVRLGAVQGADVHVVAGLTVGEQVVVVGPDDLADGDAVEVQ